MPLREQGVLMIHARYREPGGEDVSVQTEAAVLRAAGIPVYLLEVPAVAAMGPRAAVEAVWNRRVAGQVRTEIAVRRPALVHVQNLWPAASPAVLAVARAAGVPVVATVRNARRLCPAGTLWRGEACGRCAASPWPGILRGCWRGSRAGTLISACANRWHPAWAAVSAYIAPSAFLREALAPVIDPVRVHVVPNRLPPLPEPAKGGRAGVLYAGRLAPEKGVDFLRRAAARAGLPLTVLGGASAVPAPDAWAAMGQAAVVAVPSLWPEPFGRAALEGMAMGAAVVASATGGLPEVVGRAGLLVPPGDENAWAVALRQAVNDQPRLGSLGRARAAALCGDGATPLLAVYETCLTSPVSRHQSALAANAGTVRR